MRAASCLLAGLALACGPVERGTGRFEDQEAGARGEDAGASGLRLDAGAGAAELARADGQWLLYIEDHKCLEALGTVVESLVYSWYLVDVREAGGGELEVFLRQELQLCRQVLSPLIGGLTTVIPDALPMSLPAREVSGFALGRRAGDIYLTDELVDLWGAQGVPLDEPMPAEVEDPRVFDQDDDGKPGVTFVLVNRAGEPVCEVYVAQRTKTRLTGTLTSGARIEGTLSSEIDKALLDATSPLCSAANRLVQSRAPNRFVMVRADGQAGGLDLDLDRDGRVDCDEVRDAEGVLSMIEGLERAPPDDGACR